MAANQLVQARIDGAIKEAAAVLAAMAADRVRCGAFIVDQSGA